MGFWKCHCEFISFRLLWISKLSVSTDFQAFFLFFAKKCGEQQAYWTFENIQKKVSSFVDKSLVSFFSKQKQGNKSWRHKLMLFILYNRWHQPNILFHWVCQSFRKIFPNWIGCSPKYDFTNILFVTSIHQSIFTNPWIFFNEICCYDYLNDAEKWVLMPP